MRGTFLEESDTKAVTVPESEAVEVKPPGKYKVILTNDDYTPMEFVVDVLQKFFRMNITMATQIMLQVHNQGRAVCGLYSRDVAETIVMQVNQYAQVHEHPLLCCMELE